MDEEQYTESTELVLKYQDGDKKAGEQLLENYENTVRMFVKMLYYGNFYKGNKLINSFTSLLCSKGTPNREERIKNIMSVISTKYQSYYSVEDIEQDIKEAILQTALRYDPSKIEKAFEYFFQFYFAYLLKANTIDRLDAPISLPKDEDTMDFIKSRRRSETVDKTGDVVRGNEFFVEDEPTSELFEGIDKEQRKLLKKYYLEEKTLEEISNEDEYDVTLNALSMRLKKIRNIIKENKEEKGIDIDDVNI